jgi:hypothetical protein
MELRNREEVGASSKHLNFIYLLNERARVTEAKQDKSKFLD